MLSSVDLFHLMAASILMMVLSPCTTTSTSPCRYHGNQRLRMIIRCWALFCLMLCVTNFFLYRAGTLNEPNDCFWFWVITKQAHPIKNKSNHHQHFIDICGLNVPLTQLTPWFTLCIINPISDHAFGACSVSVDWQRRTPSCWKAYLAVTVIMNE